MKISELPLPLTSIMEGDCPPLAFDSDGCTNSPDRVGGADLRPACLFHDWAYQVGGDKADRLAADDALFRNLVKCGLSAWKANLYYRRVRFWGVRHFQWSSERPTLWARIVLFFSRYLTW